MVKLLFWVIWLGLVLRVRVRLRVDKTSAYPFAVALA